MSAETHGAETHGAETRSAARAIIDDNLYLVLSTVGADGAPLATPVFYSTEDGRDFYWCSSPDVTHSRNLRHEPRVSIVIFDSRARVGTASPRALYLAGTAEEVTGDEALEGLRVIPGAPERGGHPLTPEDVRTPSPWRVYRARITEYSMVCQRGEGACTEHGLDYEHRATVKL
ncbi:pyridoxamine 5'-phosphate oxidase family protein [Streptomyces sp. NPDC051940]|uniref:pyridoxamine 5'-phosphate oxidase family protein n=1 Tax=Streptomyces sp. NPDC051940 TaxID=3155675 RepID=UPI0034353243